MPRKLIAFDIMSMFHLYSVVACLHIKDFDEAYIYVLRGLNGKYCCSEGRFDVGGRPVFVKYQESGLGRHGLFLALCSSICFFLSRFKNINPSSACYILHHTYFKPSCFSFIRPSEAMRLIPMGFEEGVGSYGDLKHYRDVAKRENKKFPLLSLLAKRVLSLLLVSNFSVLKSPADPENTKAFKEAVGVVSRWQNNQAVREEIASFNVAPDNAVVVFMGPYIDMFGVTEREFTDGLSQIVEKFKNYNLVIKPHPLEVKSLEIYRAMGVNYITSAVSGEELIYILKPKLSVGVYSGALLVSRNVFGVDFEILEQLSGGLFISPPSYSIVKLFMS